MAYALLLAVQAGDGQIAQIAHTFGVDWTHLGAQIVSFGVMCAVLYKFAYRPILKIMYERRQQIAECLANSEKIKAELNRTEAQRQEVLAGAHSLGSKSIEEARAAAARVLQSETQKAIATAEQIMIKAREAAAQDHDRMLVELKHEVGRLVVQASATLIGKILTAEDQRRLAEEAAKQVAAS